jgi:hypothetical protein
VTLTLGWTTLIMGNFGEGALHEEESNCQTKKIKICGALKKRWFGFVRDKLFAQTHDSVSGCVAN